MDRTCRGNADVNSKYQSPAAKTVRHSFPLTGNLSPKLLNKKNVIDNTCVSANNTTLKDIEKLLQTQSEHIDELEENVKNIF